MHVLAEQPGRICAQGGKVDMAASVQVLHEVVDSACPQTKDFNIVRCSGCANSHYFTFALSMSLLSRVLHQHIRTQLCIGIVCFDTVLQMLQGHALYT